MSSTDLGSISWGISPFDHFQKVNRLLAQTKLHNDSHTPYTRTFPSRYSVPIRALAQECVRVHMNDVFYYHGTYVPRIRHTLLYNTPSLKKKQKYPILRLKLSLGRGAFYTNLSIKDPKILTHFRDNIALDFYPSALCFMISTGVRCCRRTRYIRTYGGTKLPS